MSESKSLEDQFHEALLREAEKLDIQFKERDKIQRGKRQQDIQEAISWLNTRSHEILELLRHVPDRLTKVVMMTYKQEPITLVDRVSIINWGFPKIVEQIDKTSHDYVIGTREMVPLVIVLPDWGPVLVWFRVFLPYGVLRV